MVSPLTGSSYLKAAGTMLRLIFFVLFYHCYVCPSFLEKKDCSCCDVTVLVLFLYRNLEGEGGKEYLT